MPKNWLLFITALISAALLFGAVACGDDDGDDGDIDATPLSTEPGGEPTEADEETPASETPGAEGTATTDTVVVTEHPELGSILTDAEGLTLYTFDNDDPTAGTCGTGVSATWPALTAEGTPAGDVPGELAVAECDDGTTQVTYDGAPLYYFSGDSAAGDANGDGVAGLWHVVTIG
jgi:predicted lipoprotein with Yx(FWY)xxD motif